MRGLKAGAYRVIVADPPWPFDNQATRGATSKHYKDMTLYDIANLPVERFAADQSHLYLWTTAGHKSYADHVMVAWGFTYKLTIAWVKTNDVLTIVEGGRVLHELSPRAREEGEVKLRIGTGNWFRHAHEICLFGVRGKLRARHHGLPTVLFAPRTEHSRKPAALQDMAELMGSGPYLELFARAPVRKGWKAWGDESRGSR